MAAVVAATALAAPIPVAFYTFETQGDADAFSKGFGAKCKKKLVPGAKTEAPAEDDEGKKAPAATTGQMGLTVGPGTNHCTYPQLGRRVTPATSRPTPRWRAREPSARNTPDALQKKAFVAVGVRNSEEAGWEFRVLPGAQKWQLLRDPAGTSAGATIARAGKGSFVKGIGKPNALVLRTFDGGTTRHAA